MGVGHEVVALVALVDPELGRDVELLEPGGDSTASWVPITSFHAPVATAQIAMYPPPVSQCAAAG